MRRLSEIRARLAELRPEIERLSADVDLDDEGTETLGRHLDEFEALTTEAEPLEERETRAAAALARSAPAGDPARARVEGAPRGPELINRDDPFDALRSLNMATPERERRRVLADAVLRANEGRIDDAANQSHFEALVKRHARDTAWTANLLGRSRPEYEAGFSKIMTGRPEMLSEEERAAMSVGSNTNGGYLVPTHLDPTLILTNSGASNVIRGMSRVVTLTEGNVWNGVTTAGVTASWDAELTEVSDDTPTVGRVSVSTYKAQSLVQASIEAFEDISGLQSDVLMLFADARDRLEAVAHATGSGAGQPFGIVTALDANTNVEVDTTTNGTLGLVDIHNTYRQLPVRWRGRGRWLMHPVFSLAIKALGTEVSASFSGDLREPTAGRILGHDVTESDEMPSTALATTTVENVLIFGDFSNYLIVDKPGSTSIEFIPHLFNTANNLPDGRRAWYMHWRSGADSINDLAFRLLQDQTSA